MTDRQSGNTVHNPLACASLAVPTQVPFVGQPQPVSYSAGVGLGIAPNPIGIAPPLQHQIQGTFTQGHSSQSEIDLVNIAPTSIKQEQATPTMVPERPPHRPGKRGRKPSHVDVKVKLERSRQSARECRARKKLRYQYLEELVASRERAIYALREELEMFKTHCKEMDEGIVPKEVIDMVERAKIKQEKAEESTSN